MCVLPRVVPCQCKDTTRALLERFCVGKLSQTLVAGTATFSLSPKHEFPATGQVPLTLWLLGAQAANLKTTRVILPSSVLSCSYFHPLAHLSFFFPQFLYVVMVNLLLIGQIEGKCYQSPCPTDLGKFLIFHAGSIMVKASRREGWLFSAFLTFPGTPDVTQSLSPPGGDTAHSCFIRE